MILMNSAVSVAGLSLRSDRIAGAIRDSVAGSIDKAHIAITIDLEMARHYPTWQHTHWDYEKGNLDEDTKRYAVEAARRVREKGGKIHFFAVGRVFEQENVEWLKEIAAMGHPIGNHTYDHVNIRATRLEALQPRFRRAPWLIHGRKPLEVIADNIRMTTLAIKERLGMEPCGFRSPGGFPDGLTGYPKCSNCYWTRAFPGRASNTSRILPGLPAIHRNSPRSASNTHHLKFTTRYSKLRRSRNPSPTHRA